MKYQSQVTEDHNIKKDSTWVGLPQVTEGPFPLKDTVEIKVPPKMFWTCAGQNQSVLPGFMAALLDG